MRLIDATTGEPVIAGAMRTKRGGIVPAGNVARMVRERDDAALARLGLALQSLPAPEPRPEPAPEPTPVEKLAQIGLTPTELVTLIDAERARR